MAKSNFKDSHIQGVHHVIADDWKDRLASCFQAFDRGAKDEAARSILRLLYGRNDMVFRLVEQQTDVMEKLENLLDNKVIQAMLGSPSQAMEHAAPCKEWDMFDRIERSLIPPQIFQMTLTYLGLDETCPPTFYQSARRHKIWGHGSSFRKSHARPFDTIRNGVVVQALTNEASSMVIFPAENARNDERTLGLRARFYVIEHPLQVEIDDNPSQCLRRYSIVQRCSITPDGMLRLHHRALKKLLQLTDATRRVATVHARETDPLLHCIRGGVEEVKCSGSVLAGNLFYFFGRMQGFPPRMA